MDPLVSERALAFGEPPVYSSRDFVTVQTSEKTSLPGQWYKAGSKFSIAIRNIAQNEFVDANTMSLQFSVAVVVKKGTGSSTTVPGFKALPMQTANDTTVILPGTPAFGCPFFSSVKVSVPSLSLESFLTTDVESQVLSTARLLCSSAVGSFDRSSGRLGYSMSGKAYDAGCRSVADRADCVWAFSPLTSRNGSIANTDGGALITESAPATYSGVLTHYNVPLSLFSHLFNGSSSMLPLAYFSSGGDLLTFTADLAPADTALTQISIDRPDLVGAATYYIIDPTISFTKTQVNNSSVLSGIEALYRGVASLPIAPGVSASMAMTIKNVDYISAVTQVNGNSGQFQLTVPANEPSMRGLLLKFSARDIIGGGLASTVSDDTKIYGTENTTAQASQYTGKHAFGLEPRIRNLVVRIGSYRIPLDPLYDLTFDPTNIPGLSGVNPFSEYTTTSTVNLDCLTSRREACRMYQTGKHLFSPFMTHEDPEADALAPFWASTVSRRQTAAQSFLTPPFGIVGGTTVNPIRFAVSGGSTSLRFSEACGPGMFLLPFESFAAVLDHHSDAFSLRGIDLRNITSMTVTGTIEGVSYGAGPGEPDTAKITTSGWDIRGMCAYDREMVILPGRCDTSAQFSLIPSGATAIPTS